MRPPDNPDARLLVVDDEPASVRLLERILARAGYSQVFSTTEPREAAELFRAVEPDLVLLDLHMPGMNGFEVLERLRPLLAERGYLPVLVLTGDASLEAKERALSSGARDFLAKPFQAAEVLLRIQNLLETRFLHQSLARHNEMLDQQVRERTADLERARIETLERLARTAEFRDDVTGQHAQRVGENAARIGRVLGLDEAELGTLRLAAPLHDIGKVGIPDAILRKPGELTPEELEIMRSHTTIGARILAGGVSGAIRMAEEVAQAHHEWWDGSGYPDGRRGGEIPYPARIVAVADVLDALTHARPYRPAWTVDETLAEIRRQAGHQFDPEVVAAALSLDWRRRGPG